MFLGEYIKGEYNLSRSPDIYREGVYFQTGYRPLRFIKFPIELTARVENLSFHPQSKGEKIYTVGFNLYSRDQRVKFTYNFSSLDYRNMFNCRSVWLNALQLQLYF